MSDGGEVVAAILVIGMAAAGVAHTQGAGTAPSRTSSTRNAPVTRTAPSSSASTAAQCRYTQVEQGERSACARQAQSLLRSKGYYKGSADGVFGASSVSAAKAFQRSQGLKADGIIGWASWDRLSG
ncbi:peptidoglycan-binding domain-containing protein [Nigerium massiliense]|uniref:peptidoglycan-binding domain-containing protein n=1 Tax=Nigerium massiliense TaxID=1522317 RepID=UPI000694269D|nr:peptidoglycan-binding domain-containing protein [Nigerium massiliense]